MCIVITEVLISPQLNQEGNKLQQQKILMFLYPIYYHNWRNISTMLSSKLKLSPCRGCLKTATTRNFALWLFL